MFVNLEKAHFKELNNIYLFKQIYNSQILEKNWKEKDNEQLEKISKNYKVLELN
jgi:uncharacterized membrane protein